MNRLRHIRFEDEGLQSALLRELELGTASYTVDNAGTVFFREADSGAVNDAAHRVRNAQFPWYFLKWKTEEESERFAVALSQAGLPVFVEHHEAGTCVLVS